MVDIDGYFYNVYKETIYRCKTCHRYWTKHGNQLIANRGHTSKCRKKKNLRVKAKSIEMENSDDSNDIIDEIPNIDYQKNVIISQQITTVSHIPITEHKFTNFQNLDIQNSNVTMKIKFLRNDYKLANVKYKFRLAEQLFSKEIKKTLVPIDLVEVLNQELQSCDKTKYSLGFITLYGIAFIIKDSNAPFKYENLKHLLDKIEIPQNQRFILRGKVCDWIECLEFKNRDIIHCITKWKNEKTYEDNCIESDKTRKIMYEHSKKYEDWTKLDF